MGLPFVIIQGPTLIVDTAGNIVDSIDVGDGKRRLVTQSVLQGGNNPYLNVDVVTKNFRNALVTTGTIEAEVVAGYDNFADTWFFILAAGAIGDTIRIQIAEGQLPMVCH